MPQLVKSEFYNPDRETSGSEYILDTGSSPASTLASIVSSSGVNVIASTVEEMQGLTTSISKSADWIELKRPTSPLGSKPFPLD